MISRAGPAGKARGRYRAHAKTTSCKAAIARKIEVLFKVLQSDFATLHLRFANWQEHMLQRNMIRGVS